MPERLDRGTILTLLAKADTKWFSKHSDGFKYREHLEFTADYIVKNYNRSLGVGSARTENGAARLGRRASPQIINKSPGRAKD